MQGFLADCFLLETAGSVGLHYHQIRTYMGRKQETYQSVYDATSSTQLVVSIRSRFDTSCYDPNQSLYGINFRCVSNQLNMCIESTLICTCIKSALHQNDCKPNNRAPFHIIVMIAIWCFSFKTTFHIFIIKIKSIIVFGFQIWFFACTLHGTVYMYVPLVIFLQVISQTSDKKNFSRESAAQVKKQGPSKPVSADTHY